MSEQKNISYLLQPISSVARQDFAVIRENYTVQQALNSIRSYGIGERIVYFYAVDDADRLVGVIPTRRLLTAPLEQHISDVMIRQVVTVLDNARVLDALEIFVHNKFLALPIVDQNGHIKGVVDVGICVQKNFNVFDKEKTEEVFALIGFHISQVQSASPTRMFRFRFPWLMATIGGGTICALFASAYAVTLANSLILAFFLTLVLGLGESVSIQSMTVTIHTLHLRRPTLKWYLKAVWDELCASFLLGAGCGLIVGIIAWLWRGTGLEAVAIGSSILVVILASAFWGLSIPALLNALKLDPKISAGPLTLALTDIGTIILYFGIATILL